MTNDNQQVPRSWLVASLAFAFLVGVSLSIPLLHGMSLSPTGYDQAVVASQQAQSVIEKNYAGTCHDCAAPDKNVPADASPSGADPHIGLRQSEGIEV